MGGSFRPTQLANAKRVAAIFTAPSCKAFNLSRYLKIQGFVVIKCCKAEPCGAIDTSHTTFLSSPAEVFRIKLCAFLPLSLFPLSRWYLFFVAVLFQKKRKLFATNWWGEREHGWDDEELCRLKCSIMSLEKQIFSKSKLTLKLSSNLLALVIENFSSTPRAFFKK